MKEFANNAPIRLDNPRAWRTYIGGKLLDELHGKANGENSNFPEEWIMSVVAARNAGREDIVGEGMSRVKGTELTLKELLDGAPKYYLGSAAAQNYNGSLGVLVKLIDSAERLTVQAHPTRAKARVLFDSPYGKTECWHILGGQEIAGEKPCIYYGFKGGIDRAKWKALFDKQDIGGMLDALHKFYVQPGDTILIEGGMPHAIGAGCFLTEIQEATDFTVRTERVTPSGQKVADFMCHQGLGFEKMFDCFEYDGYTSEEIKARWFISPSTLCENSSGSMQTLIGYDSTPLFRLDEIRVSGQLQVENETNFNGLYILEGEGVLTCGDTQTPLEKTAQFFIPADMGSYILTAAEGKPLRIMRFFGART